MSKRKAAIRNNILKNQLVAIKYKNMLQNPTIYKTDFECNCSLDAANGDNFAWMPLEMFIR
jgi:hypothetical protein